MAEIPILADAHIKQFARVSLTLILTYAVLYKVLAGSNLASVSRPILLNPNVMCRGLWPPITQYWLLARGSQTLQDLDTIGLNSFYCSFPNILQQIKGVYSQNINT